MKSIALLILVLLSVLSSPADAGERTRSPDDAGLYFIAPHDGDIVSGEVVVRFGLHGMGVAPAGANNANTGHHHLLIDLENLPVIDAPLPKTDQIRHFGGGQTETTLSLPPGTHTLQLLLGDHSHIPHDPMVISEKITITVVE